MDNEQIKEWAEQVPMEELFTELRRLTGLTDLKFTHKVVESRGSVRILFESQDLVDKVGFLKLIFKEIVISQFNSEIVARDGELMLWGTAEFSYTHPDGGSNGKTFLTFWYDDKKGWEFEQRG